ncbi:MAG TPA: EpsG family protein [Lactovum miscens]|uniref:EpsG family protein n=1 Tax=Lactovum miscens TaxID=190387 RepID=UPI002ED83A31
MLIYFILPIIMLIVYLITKPYQLRVLFIIISFGMMGLVGALRASSVGVDTGTYEFLFTYFTGDPTTASHYPIYDYLSQFTRLFSVNPHAITVVIAVLTAILFAIFLIRVKEINALYAVFLYQAFLLFGTSMNSSRQFLAISLVANAAVFLFKKKWIYFLVLVIVAIEVHSTAVVSLVLIPIYFLKWSQKTMITFLGIISIVFPIKNFMLVQFMRIFPDYAIYDGRGALSANTQGAGGSTLFNLFIFVVYFGIVFFLLQRKTPFTRFESNIIYSYGIYAYLDLILSNLVIVQRIFMYFSIMGIIAIPLLFKKLSENVDRRTYYLINSVFILFMIFYLYIQLEHDYIGIVPYSIF